MLDLNDLFHLPQVDELIGQLVADGPGLFVVAGFDPQLPPAQSGFPPSGRAGLFRILMRQILSAKPASRALVVTDSKDAVRLPRGMGRLVDIVPAKSIDQYADCIAQAAARAPDLLVVDRLNAVTAPAVFDAARSGIRVLTQTDTVFRGAGVVRQFVEWGLRPEQMSALSWVISIQRMATLCPTCKRVDPVDARRIVVYKNRYANFDSAATYFHATGCAECKGTGRKGDISTFDILHADWMASDPLQQPSTLSIEDYVLALAAQGYVSLDDLARLEKDQLHRLQQLLMVSERAWADNNAALQRKVVELEMSNRVLQQRTEALISLEKLGSALITSTDLNELAASVCRLAGTLCGADRAILYLLRSATSAEVLAVNGWSTNYLHRQLDAGRVFGADLGMTRDKAEPTPFNKWPPGVPYREPDLEGARLYQGLRLPLITQEKLVGLLIVHPTTKQRFAPGEVALLRTLANQAALAIQRAQLIEDLRGKIVQLETAHVELVKKERLEHELELARQVQESLLPRSFPTIPGFAFAARSIPARQVGGDFYDVVKLDDSRFGVVIADVSDKGMPAALFMALTRSLLIAEAERVVSPREVLASVNRLLLKLADSEMFVAVFYGVVDAHTRCFTFTRAGHDMPLLLRNGAAQPLEGSGAVLGRLDSSQLHLSEEQILLEPGDRLALFTDGLADALNEKGEMFGLPRLKRLLQSLSSLTAAQVCSGTFKQLVAYQGNADQFDDMAMLVVEVG